MIRFGRIRVWLATGHTDMRKGFASLSLQVQQVLAARSAEWSAVLLSWPQRRSLEVIWHDGQGCMSVYEAAGTWPVPVAERRRRAVTISSAHSAICSRASYWRHPQETWRPTSVG